MKRSIWYLLVIIVSTLLFSCERKPYVEHKLQFEKVADNCKDQQSYFRMVSNFGGERFEFEKCLPPDFKKEQLVSERKGDTVVVSFKDVQAGQAGNVVYHLTLDIDSYPRYRLIIVDGTEYSIGSREK